MGVQIPDEAAGCVLSEFGCRRIHDRQDICFLSRKLLEKSGLVLPPGEILRKQVIDVRIDGEVSGDKNGGEGSHSYRQDEYQQAIARAEPDDADEKAFHTGCAHAIDYHPGPTTTEYLLTADIARKFIEVHFATRVEFLNRKVVNALTERKPTPKLEPLKGKRTHSEANGSRSG